MMRSREKGFTLVELVVGLAVLVIVLGLGYTVFDYALRSYQRGEERYIAQTAARSAARAIIQNIESGMYYEINPTSSLSQGEFQIYCTSQGLVREAFQQQPVVLVPGNLTVTFSKVFDTSGNQVFNVVRFQVSARNSRGQVIYTITSHAKLHNMIAGRGTTGTNNSGSVLRFSTTTPAAPVPVSMPGTFRCFIATAAYGSPMERPVETLRYFRDSVLMKNTAGKAFVAAYYQLSPPLAQKIASSKLLREATRVMLFPVVAAALIIMNWKSALALLILALAGWKLFVWIKYRFLRNGALIREG